MKSDDFVDPYMDPETGLLRNLVNATTKEELERKEAIFVVTRQIELAQNPIEGDPGLDQMRKIHRHLFQDVYPWAGELRTVDIRKGVPGAQPFMPVSRLEMAAGYVFGELRAENFLRGLSRESFVERLADFYDQVNYLHPFREGNGRTQRLMWSHVAHEAGWEIDWKKISGAENDLASRIAAEKQDLTGLKELLNRAIEPFPRRQREKGVDTNVAQRLFLSRGRAPAKVSPIEKSLARRIEREERGRE